MDAVKLLKTDHKKVKDLFREYERASKPERKQKIAEEVFAELDVHTQIEEEIFYPAFRDRANGECQELVAESLEEHHVVDRLIQEMKGLDPDDERYEAKFTVLMENVEHHIEEEEKEMFPDARERLEKDLDHLGERMEQRKMRLIAVR